MRISPALTDVQIITIPGTDAAFSKIAGRVFQSAAATTPSALEERLRRTFPRVVVRARDLAGDAAWYVYRDGRWSSPLSGPWWEEPGLPRLATTRDGWLVEASQTALGLLEIEDADLSTRHVTDFIAPGSFQDATALFEIVNHGDELTATVLIRPSSGHLLAVDLHARAEAGAMVGIMRLAEDVEVRAGVGVGATAPAARPDVACYPETDAAFRGYVGVAISRMPEPTPDGLALRLRRLYPHAEVSVDNDHWLARREPGIRREEPDAWWKEPGLPTVKYDGQAFIFSANHAAKTLLGRSLVGHHWQEFVTPGSTEQVSAMMAILAEIGRAESRFRMPRGDGSLLEFDSYTEVNGDTYTTIMRPAGLEPRASADPTASRVCVGVAAVQDSLARVAKHKPQ